MADPHPVFSLGPFVFLGVSTLASVLLSPLAMKVADRVRARLGERRLSHLGVPVRDVRREKDGRRVSVIGVLTGDEGRAGDLALEYAVGRERAVCAVERPRVVVGDTALALEGDLEILVGSDDVTTRGERYLRLSVGDKVHVTGVLATPGDDDRDDEPRERALTSAPMIAVQLAYAGVPPWTHPWRVRSIGLLATITLLWGFATLAGWGLLVLPVDEVPGRLPADHVDTQVLAHVVPPLSGPATERLLARLERDDGATRFRPPRALEARLALAGRIDPRPERAVERLLAAGFRTRAGLFALASPSPATCERGLDALAEALRGGSLQSLMVACRNVRGDAIGRAALKMGDFMRAVGGESESIISRQPLSPATERQCLPGGYDVPDASMPLCRLVHAEVKRETRAEILTWTVFEPLYARRWAAALRAERGDPLDPSVVYTIDPVELLERPLAAVVDQPIAVYQDLRTSTVATLTPAEAAWVRAAIAAERSAVGRHADAAALVDEAFEQLGLGRGAAAEDRAEIVRLAAVVALRAGDVDRAELFLADLDDDDPLRGLAGWVLGGTVDDPSAPAWARLALEGADATSIAEALPRDPGALRGLYRLARARPNDPAPLTDWARELFPACDGCGFFDLLDRLSARMDAARAIGDAELVDDLTPVIARFEAVLLNRTLAISLRAAHATEPR